jgi:predicted nucleic acid-binding protein
MNGTVLIPMRQVWTRAELWLKALEIQAQTRYRLYDSLIVASALASGARILYSEDLQSGRMIGDLLIENPFVPT